MLYIIYNSPSLISLTCKMQILIIISQEIILKIKSLLEY